MSDTHLVRCASHRARNRLFGALSRQPQAYWHMRDGSNYGVYGITDAELPRARAVKGITRVRGDIRDWLKCWTV